MATARIDDRLHATLRRARPLSQTSLGAFAADQPLLPRDDFGTYEVREFDAREALTVCRMPGEPWSLNPYVGCSHDCAYCYVPDVAKVERGRWGSYVLAKRNLPTLLAHELKRKERRDVFMSSATDPYQPAEATQFITRRCLEVLARADWPLGILSRNPLLKRDVDLFHAFTSFEIGMSVPTVDDDLRRRIEPAAPPVEGRLRTLRALVDEGLSPFANLMPTYPLLGDTTPDDIARAFADAGVTRVNGGGWRYVASLEPFVRERLGEDGDEFVRKFKDEAYMERLFDDLGEAFAAHGVRFRAYYRTRSRNVPPTRPSATSEPPEPDHAVAL